MSSKFSLIIQFLYLIYFMYEKKYFCCLLFQSNTRNKIYPQYLFVLVMVRGTRKVSPRTNQQWIIAIETLTFEYKYRVSLGVLFSRSGENICTQWLVGMAGDKKEINKKKNSLSSTFMYSYSIRTLCDTKPWMENELVRIKSHWLLSTFLFFFFFCLVLFFSIHFVFFFSFIACRLFFNSTTVYIRLGKFLQN